MISELDIKKSIVEIINKKFNTRVYVNEVQEDFKRPAFFVYLNDMSYESATNTTDEYTYNFVIQYIDAKSNELLEVSKKLNECFGVCLRVLDRYLFIPNKTTEIDSGSLFFTFSVKFRQKKFDRNNRELELMQELNMNWR